MSLIYNEPPMVFSPSLARKYGTEPAIIINQIHYWCEINKKANRNFKDGFFWCYNSMKKWHETNFDFIPLSNLKRIFLKLEKSDILITGSFNKLGFDRTKWYRVNYPLVQIGSTQNDPMQKVNMSQSVGSKQVNQLVQNEPDNTRDYTKTTTKNINKKEKNLPLFNEPVKISLNSQCMDLFNFLYGKVKGGQYHYKKIDEKYFKEMISFLPSGNNLEKVEMFKQKLKMFRLLTISYNGYKFRPLTMRDHWNSLNAEDINLDIEKMKEQEKKEKRIEEKLSAN